MPDLPPIPDLPPLRRKDRYSMPHIIPHKPDRPPAPSRRALAEVGNINASVAGGDAKTTGQRWVHGERHLRRQSAFEVLGDASPATPGRGKSVVFVDPPTPESLADATPPLSAHDSTRDSTGGVPVPPSGRHLPRRTSSLPALPARPSALTSLLLSHSAPRPPPPDIPPAPRPPSTTPLATAISLPSPPPPSPPPSPPTPTPLDLLRALRTQLESHRSPPPDPPASAPDHPAAPTTFTLHHLPPLHHHTRHLALSLHPPTHLTLLLRATSTHYTIHPPTGPITVRTPSGTSTYTLPELPYKHLPAFRYARRFVAAVRSRTVVAEGVVAGGVAGRVWADGRGVVWAGGREVEVSADGVVRGAGLGREEREVVEGVYAWLRGHPAPRWGEAEWRGVGGRWVKGVGWCREREGRWEMRFVDGVEMTVWGDGRVEWREGGKVVERGMGEGEVRARVRGFVEAGL